MQFSINIDQVKAVEWGLNLQQATLFSFLYSVPSWADPVTIDGNVYYSVSKSKIAEELPILSGKADTIKRYFQQLEEAGLLKRFATKTRAFFRLTNKAKQWNKTAEKGREENPDQVGKNIPTTSGEKSLPPREKSPTYQNTNNQNTNNHKNKVITFSDNRFAEFYSVYPLKKSKGAAENAFKKLNPDELLFRKILKALRNQIEYRIQAAEQNVWVENWKHPSTWLNQKCWDDEIPALPDKNATQSVPNKTINDFDHDSNEWVGLAQEMM